MTAYYTNEYTFELADEFKDKTVNVFSLTDDGPSDVSLVITRDRRQGNENISDHVARKLREASRTLPQFKLIKCIESRVPGDLPAMSLEFSWVSKEGMIHQQQVSFVAEPEFDGVVLTFTASAKNQISPRWQSTFAAVIASLRPRT